MSIEPSSQSEAAARAAGPADAELMERLARRDMDALALIVCRHQRTVWNLAYRVTGRWDLADDVTQEAFLRVLRSAGSYKPSSAFTTWLYRIVTNLCLDVLRKPRLAALPDGQTSAHEQSPSRRIEESEQAGAVQEAVAALPERQRIALVFHRFHDQNHVQIAQALECSIPAVESLLVRAYVQLRQRLKRWNEPP